ncbi:lachesin-like X2 [Biomphalaria glabrata]
MLLMTSIASDAHETYHIANTGQNCNSSHPSEVVSHSKICYCDNFFSKFTHSGKILQSTKNTTNIETHF